MSWFNRVFIVALIAQSIFSENSFSQGKDSLKNENKYVDSLNLNNRQVPQGDIRESTPLLTGKDLVNEDFIGSWPMFGTKLRMKIGGYFKADFIYDLDGTTDPTQFLMSTIPVQGTPEYENEGYLNFMAKESRINVDVRRIKAGSLPLKLFIEADFFSAGNQLRLRHAYTIAGNLIIGQTWTTLSFLESMPFMIDFAAGDALFGGRTAQIRYQKSINKNLKIAVAAEMLSTLGIENPDSLPGKATQQLPLGAMRIDYSWNTGLLILGASAAQLHWDGGYGGKDAYGMQYDVVLGGRQYIKKKHYVTFNVSYGQGSGENIIAFAGSDANAVLDSTSELKTMPALSYMLGLMLKWNTKLSSNISYAYGWLDTPESRAPYSLKRGGVGHANLIWRINPQLSSGVEYIWGGQRTTNEAVGYATRYQAMVKYEF